MAAKAVLALLGTDDKWSVTYHPTLAAAEAAGQKADGYKEGSFFAEKFEEMMESGAMTGPLLSSLYSTVSGKTLAMTDVKSGAEKTWKVIVKAMASYKPAKPTPPASDEAPSAGPDGPAGDAGESGEEVTEGSTEETAEEVETMTTKTAKTAKTAPKKPVKPAAKPATKPVAAAAPKKPVKPTPKPAAKTAAKPAAKPAAAKRTNGTLNPAWKSIFTAMAKKGDEGLSVKDMAAMCEAKGVGLYYRRFETAGLIKKAGRGVYKLTAAGTKAIA